MPPLPNSPTVPFIDTEAVQTALNQTAIALQVRFAQETGDRYGVEDLQQALTHWLELSIEELVDDALFHTVEGDRAYAFNRRAFELQIKRLQPLPHLAAKTPEPAIAA
jgi:hypothetical protein